MSKTAWAVACLLLVALAGGWSAATWAQGGHLWVGHHREVVELLRQQHGAGAPPRP